MKELQLEGKFMPLNDSELVAINGGVLKELLKKTPLGIAAYVIIDNWATIKEAVIDAWNGDYGCDTCG